MWSFRKGSCSCRRSPRGDQALATTRVCTVRKFCRKFEDWSVFRGGKKKERRNGIEAMNKFNLPLRNIQKERRANRSEKRRLRSAAPSLKISVKPGPRSLSGKKKRKLEKKWRKVCISRSYPSPPPRPCFPLSYSELGQRDLVAEAPFRWGNEFSEICGHGLGFLELRKLHDLSPLVVLHFQLVVAHAENQIVINFWMSLDSCKELMTADTERSFGGWIGYNGGHSDDGCWWRRYAVVLFHLDLSLFVTAFWS
jgi:hypothetical protein